MGSASQRGVHSTPLAGSQAKRPASLRMTENEDDREEKARRSPRRIRCGWIQSPTLKETPFEGAKKRLKRAEPHDNIPKSLGLRFCPPNEKRVGWGTHRSEERRVGKEWRSRRSQC